MPLRSPVHGHGDAMDPTETPGHRSILDQPTLVINRSWIPIRVTAVRRALGMVYRGVAWIVETDTLRPHEFCQWLDRSSTALDRFVRTPRVRIAAPEVIQLVRYDKVPLREAPFSRSNLFRRDRYTCQYCGTRVAPERLSIDHVLPRSKGGKTSWENCVLACVRCNARKGDRSPRESGLGLIREPRRPTWSPYLDLRPSEWRESWAKFVAPTRQRAVMGS
jgi:5-methylcytosine-specific restriction endonuclease McrA